MILRYVEMFDFLLLLTISANPLKDDSQKHSNIDFKVLFADFFVFLKFCGNNILLSSPPWLESENS